MNRIAAYIIVMVLALAAGQVYLTHERKAADRAGYDRRDGEQKDADNKALKEALADVARLNGVLKEISDEERKNREVAAAAAVAAVDAGKRLRAAEARLRAAAACPGAPAADGGAPADATERLLADVRGRLDAAADRVAQFADSSRRAGLSCERIHDAMR